MLFLLSLLTSSPECLTWSDMLEHLNTYGQIPSHHALTADSNTMTVFVNPAQGTWSIVMRTPLGCTKVWANGIGWRWLYERRPSE